MEKIKQFLVSEKGKDILVVIIVILVGLSCFELGRLSNSPQNNNISNPAVQTSQANTETISYQNQQNSQEANVISSNNNSENSSPINTETPQNIQPEQTVNINAPVQINHKNFFASSRGKKYYPIDCKAGKNIKESNRVYFITEEDAQQAGYTLSTSC